MISLLIRCIRRFACYEAFWIIALGRASQDFEALVFSLFFRSFNHGVTGNIWDTGYNLSFLLDV